MSLTLRDAATIVTLEGSGPIRGEAMSRPSTLEGASVNFEEERVTSVGDPVSSRTSFDASGCTVVPGFVDCHTHLPFSGWRADEDAARLTGLRYETLHRGAKGMARSVAMLAEASDVDVVRFCSEIAADMLRAGTTTFETKSGYGLSVEAEIRQLRLARELARSVPQTVTSTCFAAHAVPTGKTEGEWIGEIAEGLLPRVAKEGLATSCDIYVESIAFQLEHAARLAHECESLGLGMRMHADQLEDSQAGAFAARWNLTSADHLNHTSLAAVSDIAASDTAAVLLPGTTFTLRQNKKPPARNLIEEGAIVALGTDLNPGTSPVHSMPFVIALACRIYGLRPLEALVAATVNSAHVLGLGGVLGRLVEGYRADAVVLDGPDFAHVTYRPDRSPIVAVVCGGELAYVNPGSRGRLPA